MASGEFLARIKLALEGKEAVVAGLEQTQLAAQQLSKTKVTTTFDKEGLVTGKQIEEQFKTIKPAVEKANIGMKDFEMAMRRALIVAPVWMLMRAGIQAVTNTIKEQVKFLIDLETAMARIKIVGKGTTEEYKTLQTALVGLSYAYGVSSSEAAEAAVLFAQQGKSAKETVELTRVAMLASKILATDIKVAVDDMTAAIEGFRLGVGDATSIVDKWINVEKQFAVTSKDLADATKVAGASANQLGITMNQFLGDVTAVIEVTRKSGGDAARGLSFIYSRLLTSGKETVEQIAKIPFYLDATGKATNTVGSEMRSISAILGDLAGKWDTLTVAEKLEIATSLGSKRQMVTLYALMQNYNTSLDARIAALTSAGAAEKAFAIIQDTTATKLKQVSSAWNVLTTAIGDTSSFKTTLSFFDKMLINLTYLINYEKAYGALYSREINKAQLASDTRLNEIKSLEELLSVREKLAKVPQTVENVERLKTVQDAIDSLSKKEPRIRVALEAENPDELKRNIENITNEINLQKIRLNVSLEFEPKIAAIETRINSLNNQMALGGRRNSLPKEVAVEEAKLTILYKEQAKAIEDQYKIQKGQVIAKKMMLENTEGEESISTQLTEAERERLSIEVELLKVRYNSESSLENQIQKEIQLVTQSKNLYDIHTKNLKLEELSNKLIEVKLQKRQKEISSLVDLSMKYEKADMFEKGNIRRLGALQQMKPEELATTYGKSAFDKNLITEYWTSFNEEAQLAIAKTQNLFKELSVKIPEVEIPKYPSVPYTTKTQGPQNITNTIVGAQINQINVSLPEVDWSSLADEAGKQIAEKLRTDGTFQLLIANGIRNKI
jgi:TP901 family phage tail tape measure protein